MHGLDGSEPRELHYRLFAKLLMFLTFFLGGLIGYFAGVEIGEANAIQLIQEGRLAEQTAATKKAAAPETSDATTACYEKTLGKDHYAAVAAGTAQLSVDEVFKLLPCTNVTQ